MERLLEQRAQSEIDANPNEKEPKKNKKIKSEIVDRSIKNAKNTKNKGKKK